MFLDLKQYHSLEHAEIFFFYLDIYFVKEN